MTDIPDRFLDRARVDEEVEVDADDADVVALFFSLDTQWRRHPFTGQRVGLDYASVQPIADLGGFAVTPATLPELRTMEHAALQSWAEAAR